MPYYLLIPGSVTHVHMCAVRGALATCPMHLALPFSRATCSVPCVCRCTVWETCRRRLTSTRTSLACSCCVCGMCLRCAHLDAMDLVAHLRESPKLLHANTPGITTHMQTHLVTQHKHAAIIILVLQSGFQHSAAKWSPTQCLAIMVIDDATVERRSASGKDSALSSVLCIA